MGPFDERSMQRISRSVQKTERQSIASQAKKKHWPSPVSPTGLTIQAPAEGIPAANNYTPGSASCKIMQIVDGTWKDTGETEDVLNPSTEVILKEGLRLGWPIWDGSAYVVISKLCGDNREFVEPSTIEQVPIEGEI